MKKCLQGAHVPEWMTKGKAILIQKDKNKGTTPDKHRPITCLPMTQNILTAQVREEIYYSPRIIPWWTERLLQRIQMHSRVTLHSQAHPKQEQDPRGKI